MTDLETREFEVRSIEEDGTFEAYAIRYGEVANIGNRFKESFERGAFDGSTDIKLYRDHKEIIGHVIETEDRAEGFWFKAKVALSALGSDTLALLRSGALSKVSVSFFPVEHRDDNGVIVRTKALLREISVVERPAYQGASILSVRTDETQDSHPRENHNTEVREDHLSQENNMTDSVDNSADLAEVRGAVEELDRKFASLSIPRDEAPVADNRSAAAFVKALASGDEEAIASYNRTQEHLHDEAQTRAFTGGTTADAPVRDAWVGDLTRLFDASSGVLSNFFSTGTLPATGNNIEYAQLKSNTITVTEQVNEGDDIPFGNIELEIKNAPVRTYAGGTQLSRQAIERSTLPVLNRSLESLAMAAGARKKIVLRAAFNSLVTARNAVASNGGVVTLGSTLGASDAGRWEDVIIDAAIKYDGINASPEVLIVSPSVFKKLRSLTVSGERVFRVAQDNASGTLNLPGLTGNLAGIPVVADPAQVADQAVFANARALRQYDSALVSLSDDNITNLTKTFAVYRYGAVAAEFPEFVVPVKLSA